MNTEIMLEDFITYPQKYLREGTTILVKNQKAHFEMTIKKTDAPLKNIFSKDFMLCREKNCFNTQIHNGLCQKHMVK